MNTPSSSSRLATWSQGRPAVFDSELSFCHELSNKPVETGASSSWYQRFFSLPELGALHEVGRYRQLLVRARISTSAWSYCAGSITLALVTYTSVVPLGQYVAISLAALVCHFMLYRVPQWYAAQHARVVAARLPLLTDGLGNRMRRGETVQGALAQLLWQGADPEIAAAFSKSNGSDWLRAGLCELQLRYPHPEFRHFCTIAALLEGDQADRCEQGAAAAVVADVGEFLRWYRTQVQDFQRRAQKQRAVFISLCAGAAAWVLAAGQGDLAGVGHPHILALWQELLLVLLLCVSVFVLHVTSAAAIEGYDAQL